MFAMNHCRMEKGFRHLGHDIGEDDTPFETGLGFAVDLSKPGGLLGADVLRRQKEQGLPTPHRTVAIAVEGSDRVSGPFLAHNETIWHGGKLVGHVTSGAWGYRMGKSLGLTSLTHPDGVSAGWLNEGGFSVRIAGSDHPATAQLKPFYDPTGERMRA